MEGLKSTSGSFLGLRPRGGKMIVVEGGNDRCRGEELLDNDDPEATSDVGTAFM